MIKFLKGVVIFMEDTQILNQDREQKVQAVLSAIDNVKKETKGTKSYRDVYDNLLNSMKSTFDLFKIEEARQILEKMGNEVKFSYLLLSYFVRACKKNSLDLNCEKQILEKTDYDFKFNYVQLFNFLDVCKEKSFDTDFAKKVLNNIKMESFDVTLLIKFLKRCCDGILDQEAAKNLQKYCDELSTVDYKLFLSKCNSDCEVVKEIHKNKKLGILGSIGVIIGGLSGLVAIGLGAAIGVGALAVTIFAPIVAAVVSLVLIGIFSYLIDKFRVNKVLNEILAAKLNAQKVNVEEIPSDLRKRKKIRDALDKSKEPLLQNGENEIVQ